MESERPEFGARALDGCFVRKIGGEIVFDCEQLGFAVLVNVYVQDKSGEFQSALALAINDAYFSLNFR